MDPTGMNVDPELVHELLCRYYEIERGPGEAGRAARAIGVTEGTYSHWRTGRKGSPRKLLELVEPFPLAVITLMGVTYLVPIDGAVTITLRADGSVESDSTVLRQKSDLRANT